MSSLLQALCAVLVGLPAPFSLLPASAQSKPPPAEIRVAYIPIANYAPLLVARDKGYFAEENLSVTWSPVAQGAVAVEAVFPGSRQDCDTRILETIVARDHHLDFIFLDA